MRNGIERQFGDAGVKRWKILKSKFSIHYDPIKIFDIFNIIASFHNAFGSELYSDYQTIENDVEYMIERSKLINDIAQNEAKSIGWSTTNISDITCIPDFDKTDIRNHAVGPYVVSLSTAYHKHSHLIKFQIHPNHPNCVKCVGLISRHKRNDVNKKQYQIIHRFVGNSLRESINWCSCKIYHRIDGTKMKEINTQTEPYRKHCIDSYENKESRDHLRAGIDSESDSSSNDCIQQNDTNTASQINTTSLSNMCWQCHVEIGTKCAIVDCNSLICSKCAGYPLSLSSHFCVIHKQNRSKYGISNSGGFDVGSLSNILSSNPSICVSQISLNPLPNETNLSNKNKKKFSVSSKSNSHYSKQIVQF